MRVNAMETKRDKHFKDKDNIKHCKLIAEDEAQRRPLDFKNNIRNLSLSNALGKKQIVRSY